MKVPEKIEYFSENVLWPASPGRRSVEEGEGEGEQSF
jgi:hypothetical protein